MIDTDGKSATPWYKKWWGILLLICVWPATLTWIVWKKTNWTNPIKIIATAGVIALFGITLGITASQNMATQGARPSASTTASSDSSANSLPVGQATQPTDAPVQAQTFTGTGDDVLHITKPTLDSMIIYFECPSCSGNAIVETNGPQSLLVNTIGSYSGSHLIDLSSGAITSKVTITATGSWTLKLQGLDAATEVSGNATGHGDSVLHITSDYSQAKITNDGESNFIVTAYPTDSGMSDLVVNTIGGYSGTVPVITPAYIQIESTGDWSFEPSN